MCFALAVASREVVSAYKAVLDPLGLTHPQYLVMLALWQHDDPSGAAGMSVKELSSLVHLDPGTLSPLLKRLDLQGLVERRASTEDERRVHVHLTEEGRDMSVEVERLQKCVADAIDLDADEFVALRTLARRVASLNPAHD